MASKTLPSDALARWIREQRWFGAKGHEIRRLAREDRVPVGPGAIWLVSLELDDDTVQRYAVPLLGEDGGEGPTPADALDDPEFCRALLELIGGQARAGHRGEIVGVPTPVFPTTLPADLQSRRLGGEQSNTSVTFGQRLILKHFRRLQAGINPDAEITRFLTERTTFTHTPRLAGHLEYRAGDTVVTLAVLQELVPAARDGWQWMVERLGVFYDTAGRQSGSLATDVVRALAGETLPALRHLGEITGELHRALASDPADPAFAPESITQVDLTEWAEAIHRQVSEARRAAHGSPLAMPAASIDGALDALRGTVKIRHHGDFHLGQTLRQADGEFTIIDFEGEPLRPIAERRRKHAAVRDVAGLLRSIEYAAASAAPSAAGATWGEAWAMAGRDAFVTAYRRVTADLPFVPDSAEVFAAAVAVFELEKAAYEIVYEANNRPAWIVIPVRGFLRASASLARRSTSGAA